MGMMANTGWLEQTDTGLAINQDDEHGRTPGIPLFEGAPPFITKTLLTKKQLWKVLKDGSCNSGTMKGHRTNLFNYRPSGISTFRTLKKVKVCISQRARKCASGFIERRTASRRYSPTRISSILSSSSFGASSVRPSGSWHHGRVRSSNSSRCPCAASSRAMTRSRRRATPGSS